MELLGGYGSGSDSEPGSPQVPSGTTVLLPSSPPRPSAAPAGAPGGTAPAQLLSRLPAPSGSKAPLFSGLPQPAQKKKVVVQFRVPISFDRSEAAAAEEEEPARKRQKASSRGRSLSELLPAPKNAPTAGGRRLEVLGSGGDGGGAGPSSTGGARGSGRRYDSDDDDDIVPGTEGRSGMVELRPGDAPAAAAVDGNEAFRVDAPGAAGADAAAAASQQWDQQQQAQYAQWQAYYQQQEGHGYTAHQQQAAAAAAASSRADPAEAMLQAALAAERERAARRGQSGAAAPEIQIREVHGGALKHMAPGQRAEADALRNAFGVDYEAKLRQEAGPDPGKLAKRRHQISSLYHYAKQKELEQLEVRGTGVKTKAETHRKYGW